MELGTDNRIRAEEIGAMVERVADEIFAKYGDKELVLVILLNGGMFFGVDLARALEKRRKTRNLYIDTLGVASRGNLRQSSGEVTILKDVSFAISGRHVVIVDEVADTRYTLEKVKSHLGLKGPKSLSIAIAVDKTGECRVPGVRLDFVGFPDVAGYLVGYGMDDRGTGRGLDYIESII